MMTKPVDPFDRFMDVLVDELISMPDADVLEGLDPEAVRADGLRMLQAAQAEAGRRRLAAAKRGVASLRNQSPVEVQISVEDARLYLARASNDPLFTMAARNLDELSDEEILRLYSQAKALRGREEEDSE